MKLKPTAANVSAASMTFAWVAGIIFFAIVFLNFATALSMSIASFFVLLPSYFLWLMLWAATKRRKHRTRVMLQLAVPLVFFFAGLLVLNLFTSSAAFADLSAAQQGKLPSFAAVLLLVNLFAGSLSSFFTLRFVITQPGK